MSWLKLLGQASLPAAVMILAVAALRIRFRRQTPQRVYCLLWDIVLLRLLVPVSVPSPFSIRGLLALLPSRSFGAAGMAAADGTVGPAVVLEEAFVRNGALCIAPQAGAPAQAAKLLPILWCAGMALCAGRLLWGHLQSRSLYAMSLPVEDGFIRRWQDRHPLRRFVQVRRSDRIPAPLTYGVLQPVVLLPGQMDLTDRENLSYVLEHEYTHIRRFDTLRKYLLAAGLCLHWFNPLVWLMYVLACRDIELACDEAVVRSGADRRGYALALLRLEEERGGWPLSGSHFSGHALEERIEAIMKHKNVSLAALLAVLVIMSVTTTIFATSAPEDKNSGAAPGLVDGREVSAVAENLLTISKGPDGETYFSVDGGETWMSEERYHAQYGDWGDNWDVEWWTYDEYKAWLENEKKELSGIIGERGYTSDKGWFVWDQAMVDETIAMYEQTLEHIKNGGLYSKTLTDPNGAVVEGAVLSSGTTGMEEAVQFSTDDWIIVDDTQAVRRQEEQTAELLKSLRAFGVTGSEEDGLYYNGQPIRFLVDGYRVGDGCAIQYVYSRPAYAPNEAGAVDVHTLREEAPLPGGGTDPAGPLKAVVSEGDDGYDPGLFDCLLLPGSRPEATTALGGSSDRGRTFEEIFAAYEKFGLRYDAGAENEKLLTCNGQPVLSFADLKPDGGAFSYQNPYADSGLNIYTRYDADGNLAGLTAE